ncbi:MAG: ATP-grasp domain-containing protein [bacterium]|nr:ATP-grasp domain-containing protein [bacterium]
MRHVVFVVPFALDTTLRFLRACIALEGVRVGVISQEGPAALPREVRAALVGHRTIDDPLDSEQLERAVCALAPALEGRIDALIGILEQLQVPLAEVRERLGIRGMDVATAHNFRDKARMKDLLRKSDLPCARHGLAKSAAEALTLAKEVGYPLVVKPPDGAGARNTFRVEAEAELASWVRTVPPTPASPLLLEEFVRGREHSFDSVSVHGEHVFHSISRYTPTPLEVMQHPWIQWCVVLPRSIDSPEYDDIRAAGRAALSALGLVSGLTHMEWFRRPDGSLAISEVAARPPGAQFTSLLSVAYDHDFYGAWAELMAFERFAAPERKFAAGAIYLRGQGGGVVQGVHGIEAVRDRVRGLVVDAKLPQPGQKKSSSYEGEGYVILRHADTDALEEGLALLLKTLRVELDASSNAATSGDVPKGGAR